MKTESEAMEYLNMLKPLQEKLIGEHDVICPRCGNKNMAGNQSGIALSRYVNAYICDICGADEAIRAAEGREMPLAEWAIIPGKK